MVVGVVVRVVMIPVLSVRMRSSVGVRMGFQTLRARSARVDVRRAVVVRMRYGTVFVPVADLETQGGPVRFVGQAGFVERNHMNGTERMNAFSLQSNTDFPLRVGA